MVRRVLIFEPSELVQAGLRAALDFGRQWEVVGTFGDLQRLDERLATSRAELVIVNPVLSEFHRRDHLATLFPDNVTVVALDCGNAGRVRGAKFDGVIDLFEPLCRVDQRLNEAFAQRTATSDEEASALHDQNDLSDREKEILIDVLKAQTNKEIAAAHNISIHTVISHRKNITRKTGIKSLSGLTVYALLNNLIVQSDI